MTPQFPLSLDALQRLAAQKVREGVPLEKALNDLVSDKALFSFSEEDRNKFIRRGTFFLFQKMIISFLEMNSQQFESHVLTRDAVAYPGLKRVLEVATFEDIVEAIIETNNEAKAEAEVKL